MDSKFQKCRLCLKLGDFCSIFDRDDSIKLSDMVMAFTDIQAAKKNRKILLNCLSDTDCMNETWVKNVSILLQIHEGDGYPDRVCNSCIENLSTAYLFKLQCERIDAMLRKSPDNLHNIDEPDSRSNYNVFIEKDFHMHNEIDSAEGENDQNAVKDMNCMHQKSDGNQLEISDETDSDVDSVKCVYCSQSYGNHGAHRCHVTCTIENNNLQRASSTETLVAADTTPPSLPDEPVSPTSDRSSCNVSCVLCDEIYNDYDSYVLHLNKCTTNVKLHHYVCPICHEINSDKLVYLEHLKQVHFKSTESETFSEPGEDCVDYAPILEKTRRPKAVRRQIGWSIDDIYQEIEFKKVEEKQTPTSSPLKNFFSKLGNESFSKQSTPKKVSFRKWIETSKAKTSNYLPFRKYIQNYKLKKNLSNYSPIKKQQVTSVLKATIPETVSDSDYNSPGGTSEESWKMKQSLICACDKKVFMLSEFIQDRDRITAMLNELGGVVAENTKMEMLATHFVAVLPRDTFTGMMVCALATGKWLLHISYVYDSFRCKKFLNESMYEWMKHPKILEIDNTSVEVAKAAVFWHLELTALNAKYPFEGKQIVLIMKKKYRQYYQMIFKTLKAKPVTYDPRTPGSCCSADYCFVDMKVIERVKLRFFALHSVPVLPYQYILVYLLRRGRGDDESKYLLQECKALSNDSVYYLNNTF